MSGDVTIPLWLWTLLIIAVVAQTLWFVFSYPLIRRMARRPSGVALGKPTGQITIAIGGLPVDHALDLDCECGHPASHHNGAETNDCRDCEDCWKFTPAERAAP